MIVDERPINPDKKYLEEYLESLKKVEIKPFLKKKSQEVLPCYHNRSNLDDEHKKIISKRYSRNKSKAQIYQEIKQKNLKRFGEKKEEPLVQNNQQKKINPKKMTVSYKPKVFIDTTEYKKEQKSLRPKQNTQIIPENNEKVQYEKLIAYFGQQMKKLQQQKGQFKKVAQKLKFKQTLKDQQGLAYSIVKKQVQKKLTQTFSNKNIQDSSKIQCKVTNNHSRAKQQYQRNTIKEFQNKLSKTCSVNQIRKALQQTTAKMQMIKTQMLNQNLFIKQHRYEIFDLHLIPTFQPKTIYDYINISTLKYSGNSAYKLALKTFNSKFQKENASQPNVCQIQGGKANTSHIQEKYIGDKRISKYQGWTQVWIPGKQRLLTNKQGYKVIWLANGDVLQQFPNNIKSYFSKSKDLHKIEYKDQPPIYYHQIQGQIWRYLEDGSREIIFKNGMLQYLSPDQQLFYYYYFQYPIYFNLLSSQKQKLMKNLESKQMPFRTIDEFYKPFYKEKVAEGIKVFPKSNPQNIILPKGQLPSIFSYLSGLNAAKQLPRRIYNRQQYFSVPKKCKKLNQKSLLSINNQTVQQNSRDQRLTKIHLSTINSINTPSNSSFSINRLKFNEGKHLQSLKNQFNQTIREKSDNKQLKYSFYNTLQKNEYFHKSFYRDNCLTQRKTAKFQNTFRRNIHAQEILKILEKSKEKLRTGI